jgi:hypothetical protein
MADQKKLQGQATPRDLKDLKIAHDDFVLVKDREGFLRKQKSLEQLMEHYASKADQNSDDLDLDKKSVEKENFLTGTQTSMGIRGQSSQKNVPMKPPAFCANIRFAHKFYFRTTSAITAKNIRVAELIAIAGMVGTVTNSTAATICSSMKLANVTVWPAAGSVTNNPEIAFAAANNYGTVPEQSIERAIPSGITTGGGIKWVVPTDSLANLWQNAGALNTEIFTLYDLPSGSVICVSGYWCLRDTLAGINMTGFTSLAVGGFVYSYLDGVSDHKCLPVGLPNTF